MHSMHLCLQAKKEKERSRDRLNKLSVNLLNEVLDVFDLPRGTGDEGKKVGHG